MNLPYKVFVNSEAEEPAGHITLTAQDELGRAFRIEGETALMLAVGAFEAGEPAPDVAEVTIGDARNLWPICRTAVSMTLRSGLLADALAFVLRHEPDLALSHIRRALLHHHHSPKKGE